MIGFVLNHRLHTIDSFVSGLCLGVSELCLEEGYWTPQACSVALWIKTCFGPSVPACQENAVRRKRRRPLCVECVVCEFTQRILPHLARRVLWKIIRDLTEIKRYSFTTFFVSTNHQSGEEEKWVYFGCFAPVSYDHAYVSCLMTSSGICLRLLLALSEIHNYKIGNRICVVSNAKFSRGKWKKPFDFGFG